MAITQAQTAAILGITARRLRQKHHEGSAPPQNAEGQYDEAELGVWMRAQQAAATGTHNYEAERARLTFEQADKVALENAELRGELVRCSEVGPYWAGMVAGMRARLVSLVPRVAALIPDLSLRTAIQSQAEALVYEALREVEQDGLPPSARERAARAARTSGESASEAAAEADGEPVG